MMLLLLLLLFVATGVNADCVGHHQHKSVYSLITPNNAEAVKLKHWFDTCVIHGHISNKTLTVHMTKYQGEYSVQVKECPTGPSADINFRCQWKALMADVVIPWTAENWSIYRPLPGQQQVLPLWPGEETVKSLIGWRSLLIPMTHEAGVNTESCRAFL